MATFKTTSTDIGRVNRLITFITRNEFLFAFGQSSQWTNQYGAGVDEENPPEVSKDSSSIINPLFYKRAEVVLPVVESDCGVFSLSSCEDISASTKWTLLPIDTASQLETIYAVKPSNVYVSGVVTTDDRLALGLTEIVYRTVGLYVNPTYKEGTDLTKSLFTLQEVQDPGILYWYSNHTLQTLIENEYSSIKIIFNL